MFTLLLSFRAAFGRIAIKFRAVLELARAANNRAARTNEHAAG